MLQIAIPIILILIGLALILKFRPKPKPPAPIQAKEESPKKEIKRSVPLEDLVLPGNFPSEIFLYFGSQTGTAEKLCNTLQEEAMKVGVQASVIDFEDFKPETFCGHQLIIVCAATHYEGDPCDNTKKFFKWVRETAKSKEKEVMKGVKFTVFGLGDTSYEQYNYIGKYFDENFQAFGGERIYKYGEGNAEGNKTEDDFNEWKAEIWKELFDYYAKQESPQEKQLAIERSTSRKQEASIQGTQLPLFVRFLSNDDDIPEEVKNVGYELTSKQFASAHDIPIESIVQLRQNLNEGSTLEITYDLSNTNLTYKTAANLAIFPQNSKQDVELCCQILGLDLDAKFVFLQNPNSMKKGQIKHPFPTPITVRDALLYFVDLRGPIRRKTIKDLSAHCINEFEKKRLMQLSESKEDFHAEIDSKQIGLLQILQQYKSLDLSPDAFFQISQRIMPRYYTIASSSLKDSKRVKIAISLTQDKLSDGTQKTGLTSKYLQDIYENVKDFKSNKITNKIFIKDSLFTQPPKDDIPMIMVGPGTGVVPFIGFLEERETKLKSNPDLSLGNAYLFFGCRYRDSDFIYKQQIQQFEENKLVDKVFYAFSREENSKVYVQDLMRQQRDLIIDTIQNKNGYFYICGNTKMGLEVQLILKEFLGEENYKSLEKDKKLIKELWG